MNSGAHDVEGKVACKGRSAEVRNACFKEGGVSVGKNESASGSQDRLEKKDEDECPWLARGRRHSQAKGLPLCLQFYILYLCSSTHNRRVSGLTELVFPCYE